MTANELISYMEKPVQIIDDVIPIDFSDYEILRPDICSTICDTEWNLEMRLENSDS